MNVNYMSELPKHECGNYYTRVFPVYEKISSNETIDIGRIGYCKTCDSYTPAASPFSDNKKFNHSKSKNFKDMLKLLKDNNLISDLEKMMKSKG